MVPPKLLQVLTEEIAKGGPASAIEVCNVKAPQMAKAASEQTGWMVKRVSLQNRNPKAVPDAWERACLLYTSDAADERSSVDLGGRRIIKKKQMYDEWEDEVEGT